MSSAHLHRSQAQEAERAVRRGEFKEALRIYRRLLDQVAPNVKAGVKARMTAIESSLAPEEAAVERSRSFPADAPVSRPLNLEQTAEMLVDRGDLAAAIATYDRILESKPGRQLARERREELVKLQDLNFHHALAPAPRARTVPEFLEELLARIASRRRA